MTTPAVNDNISIPGSYTFYSKACGGGYIIVLPNPRVTSGDLSSDTRPASINRAKSASGWRNPTNWSRVKNEVHLSGIGTVEARNYSCGAPNKGDYTGSLVIGSCYNISGIFTLPGIPSWMVQSATTKAYLKLKDEKTNFSVAFAERKETEELFVDVLHRIATSVKSFRSRSPKKIWDNIVRSEGTPRWKTIPDEWLRVQYGWNPLMQDVEGAGKALDRRERNGDAYSAKVVGTVKNSISNHIGKVGSVLTSSIYQDCFQYFDFTVKVMLWYNLDNPLASTFASLGLTNPAELIWERLPYSFVVDWFLPIGNWLQSWDADFGWSFRTGINSQFLRSKGLGIPGCVPDTGTVRYIQQVAPFKYTGLRFTRTVIGSPPGVGVPHFKNPLGGVHIANALSLLKNAFRH